MARHRPWASRLSTHGRTINTDRKSTRLNSSHTVISHAVFCLKKICTVGADRRILAYLDGPTVGAGQMPVGLEGVSEERSSDEDLTDATLRRRQRVATNACSLL